MVAQSTAVSTSTTHVNRSTAPTTFSVQENDGEYRRYRVTRTRARSRQRERSTLCVSLVAGCL